MRLTQSPALRPLLLAADRLRRRVWLPGIGAVVAVGVLTVVVESYTGSGHGDVATQPSQAEITKDMQETTLVGEPLEHFEPSGQQSTVSDGSGGHLTAVVGTVVPTTDGDGQLVFFWHNARFVGWDASAESMEIDSLHAIGIGRFRVTYSNYRRNDPACCPSLGAVNVVYRWRGHRFAAEGMAPSVRPIPARVRFDG